MNGAKQQRGAVQLWVALPQLLRSLCLLPLQTSLRLHVQLWDCPGHMQHGHVKKLSQRHQTVENSSSLNDESMQFYRFVVIQS